MQSQTPVRRNFWVDRPLVAIVITVAIVVLILTWASIRESRSDSFKLMVMQGTAFLEALTQAATNAIVSEDFYDFLIQRRYNEIVIEIAQIPFDDLTDLELVQTALNHNLYAVFVFDTTGALRFTGVARGNVTRPVNFVFEEVGNLLANPENNFLLLLDQGDKPDEVYHYYIELTNKMDRVVVLVADASYFVDALEQTQIGFLAQNMAREPGVEYIIYQSTEGIIFSSRTPGQLLSIESDSFLVKALESDTVMHRKYMFQDREVLELVRPFSTVDYQFGLLRVGLSLDGMRSVQRGFDVQMSVLSAILFGLTMVLLLYVNSRRKRRELSAQYRQIKSISDRIFERMRIGVAAVDADGRFTLSNEAFEHIMAAGSCEGKFWDEVIKITELSYGAVQADPRGSFEKEIVATIHGAQKDLLVAISRVAGESDLAEGTVSVVYDITPFRELERKHARKARLSEMGNLAAGVAHEIRNPLNTISIAIQRLASEFKPTENETEYIEFTRKIRSETKRLNEIITKFLALTREDPGRQAVSLDKTISDFIELVRPEADELGISVHAEVESNLSVKADSGSLRQILTNLFNNAKEALHDTPNATIEISGQTSNDKAVIRFADNGPGIPEELRGQVFTPFYTTKESGTGLGLPTVHRVVEELGGEIHIESRQDGGAVFVMSLPR